MTTEPLHIISLGGGVQSSCMALMAAAGEISPMPHAAIFADTQDEPASIYKWLDWLETKLPFPVYRVTAGSLSGHIFKAISEKRRISKPPLFTDGSRNEGALTRDCTRDFKVRPIQREVRRLLEECGQKQAIQWIGISLDEIQRMKPSRVKYSVHRFPLVDADMTRHDCMRWMSHRGFPKPEKSACVFCPYHDNKTWRSIRDNDPEGWARAVEFDSRIRTGIHKVIAKAFVHRSCVPLDQVDLSTDAERGQGLLAGFGNECEGMCGV